MNILFFTDTHIKNSSVGGYTNFKKMFIHLLKVCDAHNIEFVMFGGDLFDARGNIPYEAFNLAMWFIKELVNRNIKIFATVGNHDRLGNYKTYTTHAMEAFECAFPDNFKCFKEPIYVFNRDTCTNVIDGETDIAVIETDDDDLYSIAMLHHDVQGYDFGGYICEDGLDLEYFKDICDLVCVGHYHNASSKGKVRYLGSLHHMTRNDANTTKYYYLFDTQTREFVAHEMPQFHPRYITVSIDNIDSFELDNIENSIVCFESNEEVSQEHIVELIEAVKDSGAISAEFKLSSVARSTVVELSTGDDVSTIDEALGVLEEWLTKKDYDTDKILQSKRLIKEIV